MLASAWKNGMSFIVDIIFQNTEVLATKFMTNPIDKTLLSHMVIFVWMHWVLQKKKNDTYVWCRCVKWTNLAWNWELLNARILIVFFFKNHETTVQGSVCRPWISFKCSYLWVRCIQKLDTLTFRKARCLDCFPKG